MGVPAQATTRPRRESTRAIGAGGTDQSKRLQRSEEWARWSSHGVMMSHDESCVWQSQTCTPGIGCQDARRWPKPAGLRQVSEHWAQNTAYIVDEQDIWLLHQIVSFSHVLLRQASPLPFQDTFQCGRTTGGPLWLLASEDLPPLRAFGPVQGPCQPRWSDVQREICPTGTPWSRFSVHRCEMCYQRRSLAS